MVLEIVASRILAPFIGTSIIVWTSLIGVILTSLSLGYLLGGKLADKTTKFFILGTTLTFSSLSVLFAAIIRPTVLRILTDSFLDFRLIAFFSSGILFGPVSFLLGMVTPFAVKLRLRSLAKTGRTSGYLFAVSTIGGILGTFLTGFLLIPNLGTSVIEVLIAIFLMFSALTVFSHEKRIKEILISFSALIIAILMYYLFTLYSKDLNLVLEKDTMYNKVFVEKGLIGDPGREVLLLKTGVVTQSLMYLDNVNELAAEYTKFFRLGDFFYTNIKKALMLGGGAYSYPKEFFNNRRDATIDVVEIDPGITKIAKDYFFLKENNRLRIYDQDARTFINKTKNIYDVVYIDTFVADAFTPFHLTSLEAVKKLYGLLNVDGVVLINIASSLKGENNKFLTKEVTTYKAIFPQVYVFRVNGKQNENKVQNLILVGLKSTKKPNLTDTDQFFSGYIKNLWTEPIDSDLPLLTDNYAPVEYYLLNFNR